MQYFKNMIFILCFSGMYVCISHVGQMLMELEEEVESTGTGVKGSCELGTKSKSSIRAVSELGGGGTRF